MPNYNKVLLMGNLTRDPELRFTANNQAVANLGLAVNRRWRSNEGEQREETTFVDCEAWGRTAEVMNQYLKKGRPVFVEGRLKLDQWQDKEGNNRSKMKVVIDSFQFIDGQGGQGGDDNGGSPGTARTPQAAPVQAGGSPPDGPHEAIESDDIPF